MHLTNHSLLTACLIYHIMRVFVSNIPQDQIKVAFLIMYIASTKGMCFILFLLIYACRILYNRVEVHHYIWLRTRIKHHSIIQLLLSHDADPKFVSNKLCNIHVLYQLTDKVDKPI